MRLQAVQLGPCQMADIQQQASCSKHLRLLLEDLVIIRRKCYKLCPVQHRQQAYLAGEEESLAALSPDRSKATPPHALGLAMEVPFMSCLACCVHCGTGAMAPPGAESTTPGWPSSVGPRLDQVYCCPCVHMLAPLGELPMSEKDADYAKLCT